MFLLCFCLSVALQLQALQNKNIHKWSYTYSPSWVLDYVRNIHIVSSTAIPHWLYEKINRVSQTGHIYIRRMNFTLPPICMRKKCNFIWQKGFFALRWQKLPLLEDRELDMELMIQAWPVFMITVNIYDVYYVVWPYEHCLSKSQLFISSWQQVLNLVYVLENTERHVKFQKRACFLVCFQNLFPVIKCGTK